MQSPDEKLVSQTLAGDRDAFGVLVHKYQNMVYTYAFQKVRNEADSQDIAQEVFLRAYRHLCKLRHPHRFRSWLYTIMSNECNRWLARATETRRREIALEDASDDALQVEPAHAVPTEGWRVDLERAIAALPDDNRVAVSMFYMGDCSLKEISEFLGVSVNTARGKLHRARQQLGSAMSEHYGRFVKSHKLKGGFLMQLMEQVRHIPSPTMGFTWSSTTVSKALFSLITALCVLVGLIGARDTAPTASAGNQFELPASDTSGWMPVVFLASSPSRTRSSITGIPSPTGQHPLAVTNRTAMEQDPESIDRGRSPQSRGVNSAKPRFSVAASESGSNKIAFSGRVVDTDGNPIAGFPIAVGPLMSIDGKIMPMFSFDGHDEGALTSTYKSDTDDEGRFSISDIKPGPVQFMPRPNYVRRSYMPPDGKNQEFVADAILDAEVVSIDIGVMTFYAGGQQQAPFSGITFTVEPGSHLENIEIVVRLRMRFSGKIVFADGSPLANARVQANIRQRDFDGTGSGSRDESAQTDSTGFFAVYVDEPGFYSVAVAFQGLSAISEQFALVAGQRRDGLVIRLDSQPIPIEPNPNAAISPDRDGAWVINPENGNAYRSIHCESWEDAQAQAITEDAYLVSINDASEQRWLVNVFGTTPYWIGLTDVAEEGEWRWESGEPITYTNWAPNEPTDAKPGEDDYVFMGLGPDGNWFNVGPENPQWRLTRMAIIERQNLAPTPHIGDD